MKRQPKKNVFAVILAGGSGVRMGNPDKPKQYLMLGSKPLFIHTVEKFCVSGFFDAVLVMCPNSWLQQTKDILKDYCREYSDMIVVAPGGKTRNDTVENSVTNICELYETDDDTIVVTHDAVRPFVSHRIVADNIAAAKEYGACDTVVAATDTIVESVDGAYVTNIPNRRNYYQGQTPQSFNLCKLRKLVEALSPSEKELLTDACKIFSMRGEKVALVRGDVLNIKVTYPHDMRLALSILGD